jgi:hypothetical protein
MKSNETIEELQAHDEDQEHNIENLKNLIIKLGKSVLKGKATKKALEEAFTLEFSKLIKGRP